MGRLSEAFWYCQSEKAPDGGEFSMYYSHIERDQDVKDMRARYRKEAKRTRRIKVRA
jgi:hypothetical protein